MKRLVYFICILVFGSCKTHPKVGEAIFNIPPLLGKNIDQISDFFDKKKFKEYDDSLKRYKSYTYKKEGWHLKREIRTVENGWFSVKKDGWELAFCYNVRTRKVEYIYLTSDQDSYKRMTFKSYNIDDLLKIGDLEKNNQNYMLIFSKSITMTEIEISDKDFDHNDYEGVKIYSLQNLRIN